MIPTIRTLGLNETRLPVIVNAVRDLIAKSTDGTGLAAGGANDDITALSGLTTPLSVGQGGTGANTAPGAMRNLLPLAQIKTAAWSIAAADLARKFVFTGTAAAIVPLPAGSTLQAGFFVQLRNVSAFTLTFAPAGSDPIEYPTLLSREDAELVWDGSSWRLLGLQHKVLLATAAVSGVAQVVLALPPDYSGFDLDVQEFVGTSGASLKLAVSTDGGTTYPTTGYSGASIFQQSGSPAVSGVNSVTGPVAIIGSGASGGASCVARINPGSGLPGGTSNVLSTAFTQDGTIGAIVALYGGYLRTVASRLTHLKLLPSTSTFSARYRLWGIR